MAQAMRLFTPLHVCRWHNCSADPKSFGKFSAASNKYFYNAIRRIGIKKTTVDRNVDKTNISRKVFQEQNRSQPPKITPLASLVTNQYTSGRVFCSDSRIFFQIGNASRFESFCQTIRELISTDVQLRHYEGNEFRQLERDQMVLCDEELEMLMLYGGSEDLGTFEVPGALYRGRLLQGGATFPADCTGHWEQQTWAVDRLEVELIDLGVCGHVHISKIMPMPDTVVNTGAMAITIGMSDGDFMTYEGGKDLLDGKYADEAFEECCEYVHNAQFMPLFIDPDVEHLPSTKFPLRILSGTCIRRADGLIKFDMPKSVKGIPENVVKLIKNNLPFKTSVNWTLRSLR